MRFFRSLFFTMPLVLVLVLSACSSMQPQAETDSKTKTLTPDTVHQVFSTVPEGSFRGQLTFRDNKAYFETCDDQQQYKIITETALQDIYNKITDNNDMPVYIEFAGEINFAEDNTSTSSVTFRVDRIHHMALAKLSLQCAKALNTFRYKAKGDDPYWRINIHDNKLFFATKAGNQSYTLENANFDTTKINLLKSNNELGQSLTLKIQPAQCYTLDNKEYWGYITEAYTIYGNFIGCGEPGRSTSKQPFQGDYLSKSTTASEDIRLTLNANHTLEYQQGDNRNEVVKTGFWKSNTPNTVVVMLVQQGKKPIQEEIIFQRNALSLSSIEINKDNAITQFNSTLTFTKVAAQQDSQKNEKIQIKRQFTAQNINPTEQVDVEVQQALRQYFKIHRTDPKDTRFSSVRFDLNGDGQDEAIALLDWCSSTGCEMIIFGSKDKSLVFSSRVSRVQAPITVARTKNFSWASLLVAENKQWLQLDFDGLSYPLHINEAKSIEQPTDSTGVVLFNKGRPATWFSIK